MAFKSVTATSGLKFLFFVIGYKGSKCIFRIVFTERMQDSINGFHAAKPGCIHLRNLVASSTLSAAEGFNVVVF